MFSWPKRVNVPGPDSGRVSSDEPVVRPIGDQVTAAVREYCSLEAAGEVVVGEAAEVDGPQLLARRVPQRRQGWTTNPRMGQVACFH